ncbi:glycine C-acetyltransferase [Coxiella burnetii]|uniref:2-amino-3-ketobutyrate coenzyme A ligase n=2 Tax=Coxiella burnetii TaxID=777 RepID=Q83F40_COXBU|nr:glycine C-acetyltransferase [Coxiella burnetii]NP_819161.1 2-amino-3-ketobutyrate coenzyme A ligase [Coxiella burnetii RSA 493]AAO89675.1 2-amino-3-ketobutyrate coenzyme A ligase [Coxiella burnetii RSA 493]ABS78495.1 2-amino-3-ketobutyrate coenzyme A ligase [Coxiella burnetii Dugway 5J108-111]ABX77774.1 2-amino-3-ketobutyrate coenzyme A ligase [Coxiella burnetii RSA 331]ACJ19149.1 2-amino-3-ketobutyrate coenzyme A ligase [Coxiella burnetii CbuG_Q212]AIT64128.1 2-amino-3-ketobutyrate coenzy
MQEILSQLNKEIEGLKKAGLYKSERIITSPQNAEIKVGEKEVLNFCANNYLGLADHPALIKTAQTVVEQYGFGMASVRFICGTQTIHKELEKDISEFLGTDDTILYSSCFDANGGLFETLLGPEDAIISDELNHASIIDGIRLCKAQRYRYKNNAMGDLEAKLKEADEKGARFKLIATDGVFSMDGIIADLKSICDLADKYNALVMVDDSHAVGFIGENGRGTPEYCGVADRVDILTGTLGKALGGASGGYTSGHKEIIEWLRNRSRPYLFSNTVAPVIVATSLKVLELLKTEGPQLRKQLQENSRYFRAGMEKLGFQLVPGNHPIIPVMLGDAQLATNMADHLLQEGIYVVGFSYPVVPMGKARIRVQMSAVHTQQQLDRAIEAFGQVGKKLGAI